MKISLGKRNLLIDGAGLRFKIENERTANTAKAGFVVEFEGKVYAYENCCPHLGVELDWMPGVFFNAEQEYLICSTHGALFEPDTGKCVSGPCTGQYLATLAVIEEEGELYL